MSKTKPYRDVVKRMKKEGWILDHTNGSHEIYLKNGLMCPVKCTKKDIPSGTLTKIERITGLKF
ncbi:type II toxin-antitoxin system HicA family toxin [Atopobacter sp. AH10]|uniref:type II toxin-antitoxin system HicA family toxin n=1 Tax=Atopobacter sp. AH10 TaxID=2315861 RepID=UPI000EF19437|nr:type II toxin-antitoxin system HicA family toxin [Atopobacter sp. AH10]RLK63139.1 type II toxin-antitoxin system HicA family toxin [Atopobacter sp. AH10]